jgi:hypothetical protein
VGTTGVRVAGAGEGVVVGEGVMKGVAVFVGEETGNGVTIASAV